MNETRASLIHHARLLTAEHGLSGYTVEELCEPVGISRRTFFNYFQSKEAAVLGTPPVDVVEDALATFAYSPPAGDLLLTVLVEFGIQLFEANGMTREEVGEFVAAMEREPRLLADLVRGSEQEEGRLAAAIAVRERLDPSDPLPRMAAILATTMLRRSAFDYFDPENTAPFATIAARNLLAAQRLLTPTTKEPIDLHR
jgi:AcrR family transcriptional regulator